MTKELAMKEAQRRADAFGCDHVVFSLARSPHLPAADPNGWMVSSKESAPRHHVIIDSYYRPSTGDNHDAFRAAYEH